MTIPSSSSRPHLPSLDELKRIKNRIIGTPSAKCRLAQDHGMMSLLIATMMDSAAGDDVRTEIAQIIGSLAALGGHADDAVVLAALIERDTLRGCLSVLSTTSQVKLRLALVRALSGIAGDLAELTGPSLWGLGAFEGRTRWLAGSAAQTLEWFFGTEAMDIWVPLLSGAEAGITSNMIGTVVRTQPVRERLCAWRNASEREKKERRGWEAKRLVSTNGYVLRSLLELAGKKETLGNALFALAALAKDNPVVANELALQEIVGHAKSRSGDIQLSACLCATNILRASPAVSPAVDAILSVLMAIIKNNSAHSAKAAFILAQLLTDSPVYAQLAYDRGALRILLSSLRRLTPPCPTISPLPPLNAPPSIVFTGPEWESWLEQDLDQPKLDIRLREATLLCLASISLFSNDIRRALAEDEGDAAPALSLVLAALLSPHTPLRCAACHIVRALTRSVAVIRTSIIDSGLGWLVFAIFMGSPNARPKPSPDSVREDEEDPRVVTAALRAVCNTVCEFSPLNLVYIDHGLIPRLAAFIHPDPEDPDEDSEDGLRFNALWAVKNLVRKSSLAMNREVVRLLGWRKSGADVGRLDKLLTSTSPRILEQTLNILRNLSEDEDGLSIILHELEIHSPNTSIPLFASPSFSSPTPIHPILCHLTAILSRSSSSLPSSSSSSSPDILIHTTSILAHITNSPDPNHHRMILASTLGLVQALRRVLAEQGSQVRRPVIRAVLEMVRVDLGVVAMDAIGSRSRTRSVSVEGEEDADEEDEGEGAEDGDGDVDVLGIGYGVGMGVGSRRSRVAPGRTQQTPRTRSGRVPGGITGARKILTDAGFVGTLRRIVDHHPSQSHPHSHAHAHVHSPASTSSGGVGHVVESGAGHAHAHAHGHVHYGSLGSTPSSAGMGDVASFGSIGSAGLSIGNSHATVSIMGREDRDELETARMALDWLEYGEMYAYAWSSTSSSSNVGAGARVGRARPGTQRSGSVDATDLGSEEF
ncbi:ARM repeat-containing protein [Gymnopus androsaceus JB14]|uniref:ARM repeat-containing protein n=1 Tax=Gymnopus androsaceus JB14 TaxID=1447944 RepID=A0A6A4HM74_9AGAR|nr:ARM repeat-containing protein [Gymnopus androsaceus JB14]